MDELTSKRNARTINKVGTIHDFVIMIAIPISLYLLYATGVLK